MSLSEQLLSFGYAHGDGRIGVLVNFLRSHEIEKLEDVIGCPTLLGLTGIEVLHDDDLSFAQKAAPAYVCACIFLRGVSQQIVRWENHFVSTKKLLFFSIGFDFCVAG